MSTFEMTGGPDQLRADERKRFRALDKKIVAMREKTGLPLARLLREVKELELYREGWPDRQAARSTWSTYIEERAPTSVTVRRANQLIAWARLADDEWEPGFPFPPTEKHARPFVSLSWNERSAVMLQLGGTFDAVSAKRVEQVVAEIKGEVVASKPLALVTVKGGVVTVGQSGIPRLLAEIESRALRIAALGPYAIPDAAEALTDEEAALVMAQAERASRVLHRVHGQVAQRFNNEDPSPQERLAIVA